MPCFLSFFESISEVSMEMVPTSTGCPALALLDLVDDGVELLALRLEDDVRLSSRIIGRLVGMIVTSRS